MAQRKSLVDNEIAFVPLQNEATSLGIFRNCIFLMPSLGIAFFILMINIWRLLDNFQQSR